MVNEGILTQDEGQIMEEFSATFRKAYPRGQSSTEANINNLQKDPVWLAVVHAAGDAKVRLKKVQSNQKRES